jgi:hypothetical protein
VDSSGDRNPLAHRGFCGSCDYRYRLRREEGFYFSKGFSSVFAVHGGVDHIHRVARANGVKKGKTFELFFENFMAQQKGFVFIDKHCRSKVGEIDYFYRTELRNHPLWERYNYLFIEAKNWEQKIGSPEVNHFITLLKAKTVFPCCGIYLTTSLLSPQAEIAIRDARMVSGMMIILITSRDLPEMIDEGFKGFLERKCDMMLAKA